MSKASPPTASITREQIAAKYIRGSGLEIGALHYPLPVSKEAMVQYVDRLAEEQLRIQYPELSEHVFAKIDILDDGETLQTISDASQDFVIANHFLEHCEDPISTLLNFHRVLKEGGILYMAIPDKRFTFDTNRPVTTLQHLVDDHRNGSLLSREAHYREWIELAENITNSLEAEKKYQELTSMNYSIHFHTWTEQGILELIEYIATLVSFEAELFQKSGFECVVILRKVQSLPA